MTPKPEPWPRRRWLGSLVRTGLLGGISALGLHLVLRDARAGCLDWTAPCESCRLLQRCQLPRARSARQRERR